MQTENTASNKQSLYENSEETGVTFGTLLLSCNLYVHPPVYPSVRPLIQTDITLRTQSTDSRV